MNMGKTMLICVVGKYMSGRVDNMGEWKETEPVRRKGRQADTRPGERSGK